MSEFWKWMGAAVSALAVVSFVVGCFVFILYYPLTLLVLFAAFALFVLYTLVSQIKEVLFD